LEEAISLLDKYGDQAKVIAGGTELLVNIREHAITPKYLVNVKGIPSLDRVEYRERTGLKVGVLTLLRSIETSPIIKEKFGILAQAAQKLMNIQIRNIATIGGNLCQDVKCEYYNLSHISLFMRRSMAPCWKRGGKVCHAIKTDSLYHSIIGKAVKGCIAPTASDMASPLIALDADVKIVGSNGERTVLLKDFFAGSGETQLKKNEILTEVHTPDVPKGVGSCYLKYSRSAADFSIVSVAVTIRMSSKICEDVKVVVSGLAPKPLRVETVEEKLKGEKLTAEKVRGSVEQAFKGVRTQGSAQLFKVRKTESLLRYALEKAFMEIGGHTS